MKVLLTILIVLLVVHSCHRACHYTSIAIANTHGEFDRAIDETSTAFTEKMRKVVGHTHGCTMSLSGDMQAGGIETGKFTIDSYNAGDNDEEEDNDNRLSAYLIFTKGVTRPVMARLMDREGKEYGRATVNIDAKAGDARYYDFVFDTHVDIEPDSKIVLE